MRSKLTYHKSDQNFEDWPDVCVYVAAIDGVIMTLEMVDLIRSLEKITFQRFDTTYRG